MYVSSINKKKGWLTLTVIFTPIIYSFYIEEANRNIENVWIGVLVYSIFLAQFPSGFFHYPIACIYQWRTNKKEEEEDIRRELIRKQERREEEDRQLELEIRKQQALAEINTDAILTVAREKEKLDREKLILIQTLENQLATARQQDIADIEAQIRRLKEY